MIPIGLAIGCSTSKKAAKTCEIQSWASGSAPEDQKYSYYVGRGRGKTEEEAYDSALRDAQEQTIRENFGTYSQFRSESQESNTGYQVLKKTEEASGQIHFSGFTKIRSCLDKSDRETVALVQYRHSKIAIAGEKKSLKKRGVELKPLSQLLTIQQPRSPAGVKIENSSSMGTDRNFSPVGVILNLGIASSSVSGISPVRRMAGISIRNQSPGSRRWEIEYGLLASWSSISITGPIHNGELSIFDLEFPLTFNYKLAPSFWVAPELTLGGSRLGLTYPDSAGSDSGRGLFSAGFRSQYLVKNFRVGAFCRQYFSSNASFSGGGFIGFNFGEAK